MSEVIDRRISFNAGEISPWLDPRIDLEKYHAGCRQLENLRPSIYGGAIKRSGTEYLGAALTASTAVRLIPFLGGNGTDYILEFSNLKLRVWNADSATPALVASVAEAAWLTGQSYTVGQVLSEAGANYEVLTAHVSDTFATDLAANKLRLYPYIEVTTPFTAAQLNAIQFAQQNDVMYFTHPSHTPQVLLRKGSADWVLGNAKFEWPVTMGPNASRISIYAQEKYYNVSEPAAWSGATTYPANVYKKHSSRYWKSLAGTNLNHEPGTADGASWWQEVTWVNGAAAPTPSAYSSKTYYTIGQQVAYGGLYYARTDYFSGVLRDVPPTGSSFSDEAWNKIEVSSAMDSFVPIGESVVLKASEALFQSGHVGSMWVIGHRRADTRVAFDAKTEAVGYVTDPLYVLGAWSASITISQQLDTIEHVIHVERSTDLVDWEFYSTMASIPAANNQILTGTESEPVYLRLKLYSRSTVSNPPNYKATVDLVADSGTHYGMALVTAYTDSTHVTATVLQPIYRYNSTTTRWEEPAFTSVRGFPRAVTIHEGRLWFGGITAKPTSLWGSAVDAYWDFRLGSEDDRALAFTASTDESSTVEWLVSQDLLCIGTSNGEWSLGQRPGDDEIRLRRNTSFGSAAVQGRAIGDALVYLQKSRRKLREFAFNFESDKFLSQDLSMLAEHLGDAEMLQLAIQRNPESVVWVVTTRGDLLALTYERGQNVAGWCRMTTLGTFESVAVVPGDQEEDHVWVAVVREINGSTVRYIERIAPDMIRELKDGEESELVFSDCALVLNPSGTAGGDVVVGGALSEAFPTLEYQADVESRPSYAADGTNYTLAAEKPKAYATLNPTGTNNEIFVEAVTGGAAGNSITVEIAAPSGAETVISTVGTDIVITPAAGGVSADAATEIVTLDLLGFGASNSLQDIEIGSRVYHYFTTAPTTAGGVFMGGDVDIFARNFVHAINGTWPDVEPAVIPYDADLTPPNEEVVAEYVGFSYPTATFRITARTAGNAGNSIQTVSACPAVVFPSATLTSGLDATPTGAALSELINDDLAASALVTASNAPGSDGTGTVAAVGPVTLANGSNTPRWRLTGNGSVWLAASTETYPWNISAGDWSAVSPATGTPEILPASSTISGLTHLEGETVTVLADGARHPDCTVSGGEISLNYPARTAVVGLEYEAVIEPTYLESREVANFSKVGKKRIHSATMEFWKTAGAEMSADGGVTWTPLETRAPLDRMDSNRTLFTGLREEKLDGRTDRQASVILRSTAPLPLNLLSMNIRYNLNTNT